MPAPGVRWSELAAAGGFALAIGAIGDARGQIRQIDLATGDSVDRRIRLPIGHVLAVGEALAVSDRCNLELIGPGGAAIARARGLKLAGVANLPICAAPALLFAADATSAWLVGWVGEQPQIDHVDRRSGALLDTHALPPGASVRREPHTGLLFVTTTTGTVQAHAITDAGRISRTWPPSPTLELRGVEPLGAPPFLLVHNINNNNNNTWTAVDVPSLTDRWSRTSASPVAIYNEVSTSAAWSGPASPTIHWLDPRDGATIARHRLPPGRSTALLGELALVDVGGMLAINLRDGSDRWASRGRLHDCIPGGFIALTGPPRTIRVIDPNAGVQHLEAQLYAHLLGRVASEDERLSLLVAEQPPALAAFADADASLSQLSSDRFIGLAPECDLERAASIDVLERSLACHVHYHEGIDFAEGDFSLSASAASRLDQLARRWRDSALGSPEPGSWPTILVRAHRAAPEPPTLSQKRAEAIRLQLINRGVPCSQIVAAGREVSDSRRAELIWLDALACIL